jgi:hypothetical protein
MLNALCLRVLAAGACPFDAGQGSSRRAHGGSRFGSEAGARCPFMPRATIHPRRTQTTRGTRTVETHGMEGGRRTPWVTASHRQPPPGAVLPSVALMRTAAPPRPVPPPSACGVCASALPCASGVSPLGLICLRPPSPSPPCHSPPSPPVPCPAAQIRSTRSPSSEGLQHGLPNSSSLRWHLWPSPVAWRTAPKPSMYS